MFALASPQFLRLTWFYSIVSFLCKYPEKIREFLPVNGLPNIRAYVALLLVYLIWGTTLGAMRISIDTLPPALLASVRYMLAGGLLCAFCLARGEGRPARQDVQRHFVIGLMLFVFGNALSCWAVQYVSTGLSGMMVATTPFWMVAINSLTPPGEEVRPLTMFGILLGFVGMGLLLWPNFSHPEMNAPHFWWGIGIMLFTALMWSAGSIVARRTEVQTSLLMSVGLQNLLSGLVIFPFCLLTVDVSTVSPSAASVWALWYLVLFGTIVATPCYLYVLKGLPVSVSSTFAYVTPVLTVLFGWLVLHETLTPMMVAGCAVVLLGVGIVQWANLIKMMPKGVAL